MKEREGFRGAISINRHIPDNSSASDGKGKGTGRHDPDEMAEESERVGIS